jgi:hypothetical protein
LFRFFCYLKMILNEFLILLVKIEDIFLYKEVSFLDTFILKNVTT